MIAVLLKRWLIAISAVSFLTYGLLWACAGGDWDEYSFSSLSPEAFVDSSYAPFFCSTDFYYKIGHDEAHNGRFNKEIVQDWSGFLGKNIDTAGLSFLLLQATIGQIDSIEHIQYSQLSGDLKKLKLLQQRENGNVKEMLKWLLMAKANENYAAKNFNYWDYEVASSQSTLDATGIKNLWQMQQEFKSCKDAFLKQRYYFQILRAYFFNAEYDSCANFYNQFQQQFPDNLLADRCTGYLAGAFYKQKKYAQANYLYSKLFDKGDAFKTVAHYSFHPQNESDWQECLKLCKNKDEQITLWQLQGIYFDELRAVKQIYALDPKSEKLDLLLARLINLEEKKHSNFEMGNQFSSMKLDSSGLEVLQTVVQIAGAKRTSKPYFWDIAAGYLYYLDQDFISASKYYQKAKKTIPNQPLVKGQLRLFEFMNRLSSSKIIDDALEKVLLPDLLWLKNNTDGLPYLRSSYAYYAALKYLSDKYEEQHEGIKAELLAHNDTFYAQNVNDLAMIAFLMAEKKSPMEQFGESVYPYKLPDLYELRALKLAYQDKLDSAIILMKQTTSAKEQVLLGNPFNGNIKDCHDCDHAAPQKIKYTKLSFLIKMKEMQELVQNNKDVFNNACLLGNAFYNMSYFGNARYFYESPIIYTAFVNPYYENLLTSCDKAKSYYLLALKNATNDEQRAKMSYMVLKCDRNAFYQNNSVAYDDDNFAAFIPKINYAQLEKFNNTQFYKQAIKECGYFRTYLAKRR